MKYIILVLSGFILCYGQFFQEKEIKPPYLISLEREIGREIQTGLREVGNTISYVPLETKRNSLMRFSQNNYLVFSNSHVAIYDGISTLLFDIKGNFITQVGRQGRGPGEWGVVFDICFSSDGNRLLLRVPSYRVFEYDIYGKYIRSISLDSIDNGKMLPLNELNYVLYQHNTAMSPIKQSLIITDMQFNAVKTYKNHNKMVHRTMLYMPNETALYASHGEVRFMELGSDTIQTVTENKLSTYAVFNLGNKRMPITSLPLPVPGGDVPVIPWLNQYLSRNHQDGKYFPYKVYEDTDNIYFGLQDLRKYLYGYFSKRTGTVKLIGEHGFQNDIDGGLPFFPRYVIDDNILVDIVDAFELREHVFSRNASEMRRRYGQKWDELVRLANSLDDESNPVIVMVKK